MGMYTELIAEAEIKKKFLPYIENILEDVYMETSWDILPSNVEGLKVFLKCQRYSMIPFGVQSPLERSKTTLLGNKLLINCNIKNYDDEYTKFFVVLKSISKNIQLYMTRYEEDDCWRNYLNE